MYQNDLPEAGSAQTQSKSFLLTLQVYGLGMSKDTKRVPHSDNKDLGKLFLSHVTAVTKFMTETWPGVKVLMWDDMLRKLDLNLLKGTAFV